MPRVKKIKNNAIYSAKQILDIAGIKNAKSPIIIGGIEIKDLNHRIVIPEGIKELDIFYVDKNKKSASLKVKLNANSKLKNFYEVDSKIK